MNIIEIFNDNNDILPFECKHYFRIDEKSSEILININKYVYKIIKYLLSYLYS